MAPSGSRNERALLVLRTLPINWPKPRGCCWTPGAFGHTGFTGTSLWIDPLRDLYVVLLTNRVHPSRPTDSQDGLARLRPQVHEAVIAALED